MQVLPPPNGSGNGGGCGNNHWNVTTVTITTTTTADTDSDANAPWQLLQQQQRRKGKRWGVLTSKDVRGAGVGCIGWKQRPGNSVNNNLGGIVPATGKCGGDPGRLALPPLLLPSPPT
jgi:hypothetical protein